MTTDDIRRLYTSGSSSTLTTPITTSFPSYPSHHSHSSYSSYPRRDFPEDVSISESSTHSRSLRAPSPGLQSLWDDSDDSDGEEEEGREGDHEQHADRDQPAEWETVRGVGQYLSSMRWMSGEEYEAGQPDRPQLDVTQRADECALRT